MIPENLLKEHLGLSDWSILTAYRGSITHGMYIPDTDPDSVDDVDLVSICVPNLDYYFGLRQFGRQGTQEIFQNELDIAIYEAKKFIGMLTVGSPNALAILFLNPDHYIDISPAGGLLLDNRDMFIGRHLYHSYSGYAHDQIRKMTRGEPNKGRMGAKRKELMQRYGYDPKNAAHAIRLLRMGVEIMSEGKVIVERPDADELLSIKRGEWAIQDIHDEAKKLFAEARSAKNRCSLKDGVDWDAANRLTKQVVHRALWLRGELDGCFPS